MITVFGSINIDFVTPVARLPREGETVAGAGFTLVPGGKGANQALAAARAGARVRMVGAVGRDHLASEALSLLRAAGVDLAAVTEVEAPTGAAFIAVDAAGRNQIVVAAGANTTVRATALAPGALVTGDTLLLQYEVDPAQSLAAAQLARAAGARAILNAAPARVPEPDLWPLLDVLIVNEHEARLIAEGLGWREDDPRRIAHRLMRDKALVTIVTLGAEGAMAATPAGTIAVAATQVEVVDTTAAGDAFVGALAAALDAGAALDVALRHGVAAGSLACRSAGAQPSLPTLERIIAAAEGLVAENQA